LEFPASVDGLWKLLIYGNKRMAAVAGAAGALAGVPGQTGLIPPPVGRISAAG